MLGLKGGLLDHHGHLFLKRRSTHPREGDRDGQTEARHVFTEKKQDRYQSGSSGDMQVIWSKIFSEAGDIWIIGIRAITSIHFLSNFDGYIKKI